MNDQRAVLDQLDDLHAVAVDRGMYDAAKWIEDRWPINGRPAQPTIRRLLRVQSENVGSGADDAATPRHIGPADSTRS